MISCFPRPRSFNLALFLTTREDFFTMINIGIEFSQRKTWSRCSVSPRKNRLTTRFSNNTHRMKLCVLLNVCLKIKLRTFHPLPETIDIKTSSDLVFFCKNGKIVTEMLGCALQLKSYMYTSKLSTFCVFFSQNYINSFLV